ncbi:helix-turn-helix domain-containing protein [Lacticaseibacillus porcinae]|uniref:helix-turn-helix domain-containing protein n=1 Tax=Lacticaseibacillus porcinae TaxID=1123687 RepID=UPI0013DE69FB|nr:helix-turn-helix domain-containing protein [Lacticaseibacillus porcinae]
MNRQFEDLYLTPKEVFRVELLSALKAAQQQSGEGLNLKALAESLQLSYSTVYHTYTLLLKDVATMTGENTVSVEALLATPEAELSWYFVQDSVAYQLLGHLLADDLNNFDDFLRLTAYSRVTVLRRLQQLRRLARSLRVRIVYETMEMIGSELAIRIFLTVAFGEATQGLVWPFATISHQQAAFIVAQMYENTKLDFHNPVVKESHIYLAAVTFMRTNCGDWQTQMPETMSTPVSNFFNFDHRLTKIAQISESQAMFLINVLTAVYTGTDDPQIMVMLVNQTHFDPAIRGFVKSVIQQLPPELVGGTAEANRLHGLFEVSLTASVISVLTFGYDVSTTLADQLNHHLKGTKADETLASIIRLACQFAARDGQTPKSIDRNFSAITNALYTQILQLRQYLSPKSVKVGLILGPVTMQYVDLLTFLARQPAVQIVDAHHEPCDLLIVTSALPVLAIDATSAVVIHWQSTHAQTLLTRLFQLIQELQH